MTIRIDGDIAAALGLTAQDIAQDSDPPGIPAGRTCFILPVGFETDYAIAFRQYVEQRSAAVSILR